MGWGYGVLSNGKEVGYTVDAICEHEGCDCEIHRSLSYACGGMSGEDEYSCDGFFCSEHLNNYVETDQGDELRICKDCYNILLDSGDYYEDEGEGMLRRVADGS